MKNTRKKIEEFEKERAEKEIWRIQKGKEIKLNPKVEEFKRMELPGKYMAKLLYGWNNKNFEEEYLKKLERNWNRWKNDKKECKEEEVKKRKAEEYIKELEGIL